MTTHFLHHGGGTARNPNQELYPAAKPIPGERLAPAAHKEPIAFGITRLLDFSQKDGRRQAGLQQYLERTASDGKPLQAGDLCTLSAIPANSLLLGYAWGVEEPEPGVTFDLKLLNAGTVLESGINAGAVGSNGAMLDAAQWLADGDHVVAEFTSFPAKGANELRFWVTPILFVPKLGN